MPGCIKRDTVTDTSISYIYSTKPYKTYTMNKLVIKRMYGGEIGRKISARWICFYFFLENEWKNASKVASPRLPFAYPGYGMEIILSAGNNGIVRNW